MRYALSRYNKEQRELAYRFYISDCLRMMTENMAKAYGGSYKSISFEDLVKMSNQKEIEPGTAKKSICSKLRGEG